MRIQGMRRAAIGHMRMGDAARAEQILLDILSISERLRLPHQSFATLELLVDTCLAQDAAGRAQEYLESLVGTGLGADAGYLRMMKDSAAVRVAWVLQRESIAAHIEPGTFAACASEIPVLRHNLLSNELALAALRGDAESLATLVDPLIELHVRSRSMGRQDFSADVLFSVLQQLGRSDAASALATAYSAHYRRELSPTPKRIEQFAGRKKVRRRSHRTSHRVDRSTEDPGSG